ncbi:MFS transporter [Agrococcus casei]|uniref:ABC transporter, permease protein n=1 Tax=Agrococcus casei LMG 22410 TaxID=1255656 RepID=A0A1R4GC22_9MICO|nr:MFS transporter [Agrococcus casei]SJM65744.1 ABC transporter, permease protein [Agrococcus casei LMG 22410]
MSTYTDVLKTPGVARTITAQLVSRFPVGMYALGVLLHMELVHGSYAAAGLVLAAISAGQAIATPVTTRLMSKFGTRWLLLFTVVVSAAAVFALAVLQVPLWVDVVFGAVAGVTMPPIAPAVRTLYPRLVPQRQLAPLYSLDATLQELIWVLGPVAVTFLATTFNPTAALVVGASVQLVGGLWFVLLREIGNLRIPPTNKRMGGVLKKRPVLLVTVVGFLMIGSFAAAEAGVVSVFGHDGPQAGVVLAVSALGSLIGGFTFGHRRITKWSLAIRGGIMVFGFLLAPFVINIWGLSIGMFIAGIGCAPALAAVSAIVAGSVKFADTPEAYGWVNSGQLIGTALASALAGVLIDSNGPLGGLLVALAFAIAGVAIAAIFRKHQPDLSDGIHEPPPTAPVEIPR